MATVRPVEESWMLYVKSINVTGLGVLMAYTEINFGRGSKLIRAQSLFYDFMDGG